MAIRETEIERLRREMEALKRKVARLEKSNGKRRSLAVKSRTSAPKRVMRDRHLRRYFGKVNFGAPAGADNETIDRDLALEYAKTHRTP